jgi:hypothetical protein
MKKILLLLTIFVASLKLSISQPPPPPPGNYPYLETFESFSGIGGSTLTGWTGSAITLQAYTNHGTNGSNGMARNVFHSPNVSSPANIYIISPLVSTLTPTSELRFDYRIVDATLYPSTPTVLPSDASIVVSIGNDPNFTTIYTINPSNHIQSTNFSTIVVPLTAYSNTSVTIKFEINRGTNCDYWVDIDNFSLNNAGTVNTVASENNTTLIYSSQNGVVINQAGLPKTNTSLSIFDVQGKIVNTFTIDKSYFETGNLNLPRGVYFARIQSGETTYTKKLFID